ncbi:uncharacterized protein ColSpa_10473 [Colletotrichum spaethianum]|uniref:Uncharacterized protein n=1 Tax=Colletotrichum spaethianum TaxID=700344 RepID=A0AA37PDQ4_9PEZI|nr:uncharacterized protein ColSpa_10473 [Colletotrichum spaethianum]GKT50292.1 hypothetical protein ColSpa_10473 [Colletotrichum spaethianum]
MHFHPSGSSCCSGGKPAPATPRRPHSLTRDGGGRAGGRRLPSSLSRVGPTAHLSLLVPRLVGALEVLAVLVVAEQVLLVDAAVRLAVAALEPAEPVRLAEPLEVAHHAGVAELGRADKVVNHLALVDEGQVRRDGAGLPRQERVPAPEEDDGRDGAHVQQDKGGEAERDPKGRDRLLARVDAPLLGVAAGRDGGVEELGAHDRRQARQQHRQHLGHHAAEADQEHEQVAVEEGLERHQRERHGRVVERERPRRRVPLGQDVVGLHHAHVRLQRAPAELDADGQGGHDPRRVGRDDAGAREEEHGDEAHEEGDADDERQEPVETQRARVRVLGHVVVSEPVRVLRGDGVLVVGGQRRVAEDVAVVLELGVDVAVADDVQVRKVDEDVADDGHGREARDAPDVGQQAGPPPLEDVEEHAAAERADAQGRGEQPRPHRLQADHLLAVGVREPLGPVGIQNEGGGAKRRHQRHGQRGGDGRHGDGKVPQLDGPDGSQPAEAGDVVDVDGLGREGAALLGQLVVGLEALDLEVGDLPQDAVHDGEDRRQELDGEVLEPRDLGRGPEPDQRVRARPLEEELHHDGQRDGQADEPRQVGPPHRKGLPVGLRVKDLRLLALVDGERGLAHVDAVVARDRRPRHDAEVDLVMLVLPRALLRRRLLDDDLDDLAPLVGLVLASVLDCRPTAQARPAQARPAREGPCNGSPGRGGRRRHEILAIDPGVRLKTGPQTAGETTARLLLLQFLDKGRVLEAHRPQGGGHIEDGFVVLIRLVLRRLAKGRGGAQQREVVLLFFGCGLLAASRRRKARPPARM